MSSSGKVTQIAWITAPIAAFLYWLLLGYLPYQTLITDYAASFPGGKVPEGFDPTLYAKLYPHLFYYPSYVGFLTIACLVPPFFYLCKILRWRILPVLAGCLLASFILALGDVYDNSLAVWELPPATIERARHPNKEWLANVNLAGHVERSVVYKKEEDAKIETGKIQFVRPIEGSKYAEREEFAANVRTLWTNSDRLSKSWRYYLFLTIFNTFMHLCIFMFLALFALSEPVRSRRKDEGYGRGAACLALALINASMWLPMYVSWLYYKQYIYPNSGIALALPMSLLLYYFGLIFLGVALWTWFNSRLESFIAIAGGLGLTTLLTSLGTVQPGYLAEIFGLGSNQASYRLLTTALLFLMLTYHIAALPKRPGKNV